MRVEKGLCITPGSPMTAGTNVRLDWADGLLLVRGYHSSAINDIALMAVHSNRLRNHHHLFGRSFSYRTLGRAAGSY